ncbi:MAG: type II toxin-antitoxin system HicA family toxin [Phototrophicaceae bacterium]
MSKREKRLEKLRQSPKDVSFEQLRQVLEDHGFILTKVTGSHHTFKRKIGQEEIRLTIPYRKPLLAIYVSQAIDEIDRIQSLEHGEEKNDE